LQLTLACTTDPIRPTKRFLPSDAMQARPVVSVCVFVTFLHSVETNEHRDQSKSAVHQAHTATQNYCHYHQQQDRYSHNRHSHAITKQTWKVIYEQEKKKRTQDAALWYTTDD